MFAVSFMFCPFVLVDCVFVLLVELCLLLLAGLPYINNNFETHTVLLP